MNVNLTPELERLVQEKVASGLYKNQSEVVREAPRLLADQDRLRQARLEQLRSAVAEGLDQAERGELLGGREVLEKLRDLLQRRAGSGDRG